jgi:hypothetical protein
MTRRDWSLRVLLVLLGLLFVAAVYPMAGGILRPAHSDTGDTMMMGIYATLGVFLLLAVRNPSEHRSLIAFTMVQLRPRRCDVAAGIAAYQRTRRLSHRLGSPRRHRDSPARTGAPKAGE